MMEPSSKLTGVEYLADLTASQVDNAVVVAGIDIGQDGHAAAVHSEVDVGAPGPVMLDDLLG